jgi:uncharacterized membrane protein YoaK (UPF0700 family)
LAENDPFIQATMTTFFTEVRETLFPRLESEHGPLPPLLVGLTLVTGLVDAFSYLVLGHVFVANMTGNVVFLAFAVAGAKGFSIISSLLALAAFIVGSFAAGFFGSRLSHHRGHLLSFATALQTILVVVSVVLIELSPKNPIPPAFSYSLIVSLALSMGIQNATVRRLGVPDLTTTVLTLTITGLTADSHITGGSGSKAGRRITSILAMFFGALVGALMILYVNNRYPLIFAFVIILIVAVVARALSRGNHTWVNPK